MNPITINTANVNTFGFQVTVDLENRRMVFNIAPFTSFKSGGAANVPKICFEVIDPTGVTIRNIADTAIVPASASTFTLNISSGMSLFGVYKIRGVLTEANGSTYEVVIPPKDICEPAKYNVNNGLVKGSFKEEVNCQTPSIRMTETTNLAYKNLSPKTKTKTGNFYYPQGTVSPKAFTFTPFSTNGVYTGTYTVRCKTVCLYDLEDGVLVSISYGTSYEFKNVCQTRLCNISCCLEDLQREYEANKSTARGNEAKRKIDLISVPLFTAAMQEMCGKDSSINVERIKTILNCDCTDCGAVPIEPSAVTLDVSNVTFVGSNAANVTVTTEGENTQVSMNVKQVKVAKADTNDAAWTVQRVVTDTDDTTFIGFAYQTLSKTILDTIKSSDALTVLFNSIQSIATGSDVSGVDGKCVVNTASSNFSICEKIAGTKKFVNIVIDGNTYTAPSNLLITNENGAESWLNGIGKGVFTVTADSTAGNVVISSINNPNAVSTLTINADGNNVTRQLNKTNKSVGKFLQAMIDYMCALSTQKVKLGGGLTLYTVQNGQLVPMPFNADDTLYDYLAAQSTALAQLQQSLQSVQNIGCDTMKGIFVQTSDVYGDNDYVIGVKNNRCAIISTDELARQTLKRVFGTTELKAIMCEGVNTCNVAVCDPPTNVTVIVDGGSACAIITNITATIV